MITVVIAKDDAGRVSLTIQGHAGTAPIGTDLVCAAATMLCYTMGQTVCEMENKGWLEDKPTIHLVSGEGDVIFKPKPEHLEEAMLCVDVIHNGFRVLSHSYPDAVRIHYIGTGLEP